MVSGAFTTTERGGAAMGAERPRSEPPGVAASYQERVWIEGKRGRLAGELCYPVGDAGFAVLLINPHPHMGGRMGNNVIVYLAGALAGAGGVTLRFDYAGVGESEGAGIDVAKSMSAFWESGRAPEDPLMVEDARSAMRWLRAQCAFPMLLIGYSFGAHAAARIVGDDVAGLVMISPTLGQHDFSTVAGRAVPKLVIFGDEDFATSQEAFERWVGTLREPKTVKFVGGGAHFFKWREGAVAKACTAFAARVACGCVAE